MNKGKSLCCIRKVGVTMRCPNCGTKLEQETYYNTASEDTSYYNYCYNCGWDDYPEDVEDGEEN